MSVASYGGVLARAGLPAAIRTRLEAACQGAVTDETYATMARRTLQPERHYLGATAFAARMVADVGEKEALLRRMGLAR